MAPIIVNLDSPETAIFYEPIVILDSCDAYAFAPLQALLISSPLMEFFTTAPRILLPLQTISFYQSLRGDSTGAVTAEIPVDAPDGIRTSLKLNVRELVREHLKLPHTGAPVNTYALPATEAQSFLDSFLENPTPFHSRLRKKDLKPSYRGLMDVVSKCLMGNTGSHDQVSLPKVRIMAAVESSLDLNWEDWFLEQLLQASRVLTTGLQISLTSKLHYGTRVSVLLSRALAPEQWIDGNPVPSTLYLFRTHQLTLKTLGVKSTDPEADAPAQAKSKKAAPKRKAAGVVIREPAAAHHVKKPKLPTRRKLVISSEESSSGGSLDKAIEEVAVKGISPFFLGPEDVQEISGPSPPHALTAAAPAPAQGESSEEEIDDAALVPRSRRRQIQLPSPAAKASSDDDDDDNVTLASSPSYPPSPSTVVAQVLSDLQDITHPSSPLPFLVLSLPFRCRDKPAAYLPLLSSTPPPHASPIHIVSYSPSPSPSPLPSAIVWLQQAVRNEVLVTYPSLDDLPVVQSFVQRLLFIIRFRDAALPIMAKIIEEAGPTLL